MTWATGPMLALDFEATGVNPLTARPVTVALAWCNATDRTARTEVRVINCGVPVPDEAAHIHGYTTERVEAEGEPAADVTDWAINTIRKASQDGVPIVAYNARYDLTLLFAEAKRHDFDYPWAIRPVIDPMVIDKAVDKYRRGKRTLTAAAEHYKVTLETAHDAGADALAAARLAWRLGTLPDLEALTADELHDRQVVWAEEQALSLREYFVSSGKMTREEAETDVQTGWPVVG